MQSRIHLVHGIAGATFDRPNTIVANTTEMLAMTTAIGGLWPMADDGTRPNRKYCGLVSQCKGSIASEKRV
jgi:hypothetical protein